MQGKGRRAPRISLSDTTPPAPEGYTNVKWQSDALGNRSGYVSGGSASVSDTAYGASWNGVTTVAPSKNAVYDKIESMGGGGTGNPYNVATLPVFSDFSWVNQGSATGGVTSNGVLWIDSPTSGSEDLHLLVQSSAGTANTVTIALHHALVIVGSTSYTGGLVLYDSGSGKVIVYGITTVSGGSPRSKLVVRYFTNVTTASSEPYNQEFEILAPALWLRIVDDGTTNRSYQYSVDGERFQLLASTARTDHFTTPNSVGVGLEVFAGSLGQFLTVPSFAKSTP